MLTLGIETSCDETAAAVLEDGKKVLSSVVASSIARQKPFGGVVPEIASRHHLENIDVVVDTALKEAGVPLHDVDLVAVTQGPGLIGALLVGTSFAKTLAYSIGRPVIGVNHLEAHLEANFIENEIPRNGYIGLIVSGGHTSLVLSQNGNLKVIGQTRDDAAGEAFDKVAKMLGLGYPGGPEIDKLAKSGNPDKIKFQCGNMPGTFDFSFSGIKTAVLYYTRKNEDFRGEIPDIAASFQRAIVKSLVDKTLLACAHFGMTAIVVGGGVAANTELRARLTGESKRNDYQLLLSPLKYSVDNAAMIARAGFLHFRRGRRDDWNLTGKANLAIGG
ncbi:MAG: tRNA (adenosine(37)-N6)-threonylcarbamoyltransferase complex transferase subunit TsaD [Candidatus Omnitrophica bacterium]|nr:tRNA (adenosine(37)-N6)-threonylcarbamoyltransferase complex transferase subunit TsaD [Candidatus Omnitrophota bacterium]